MANCFRCGQEMLDATGCTGDRTIRFVDGEEVDPIPYGEADRDLTYQEMVENYEREIANGGRGKLGAEEIRRRLDEFTERWDPDSFSSRPCHDCGVEPGEYHHPGCDWEECPRCRRQYLSCACITDEKDEIWSV